MLAGLFGVSASAKTAPLLAADVHMCPPQPTRILPTDLGYATVRKTREKWRVVQVVQTIVFGTPLLISLLLQRLRDIDLR